MSIHTIHRKFSTIVGALALGALVAPAGAQQADAQSDRPIRLIVSYSAGGQADILARALAEPLGKAMQRTVVVDNRPGAGGIIGMRECANAQPDGSTLCLGSLSGLLTAPKQQETVPYQTSDFTPVVEIASFPAVLAANPKLGVNSLDELKSWLQANPGAAYGTSGHGTLYHLVGYRWAKLENLDMEHVPYKGGSLAITDAIAGHLPLVFDPLTALQPHLRSGALIGIAHAGTTAGEIKGLDLPPLFGAGEEGLRLSAFQGVLGPAGMPSDVVERLSAAFQEVGRSETARQRIIELGGELVFGTPQEFAETLEQASPMIDEMIELAGLRPTN